MAYATMQRVKKGTVLRNRGGCRYRVTHVDKNGCDAEIIESQGTRNPVPVGEKVWIDGRDVGPGKLEPEE